MIEKTMRSNNVKGLERRLQGRLELSLFILLPNQKVKSKNISSAGVYFEIVTEYSKGFCLGKSVTFEIVAETTSTMFPLRTIRLSGSGKVIRKTPIGSSLHKKVWGVAVRFDERLEIIYDSIEFSRCE
ncbi:MAG: hypothetical protein D8M57_08265 [Candidatus Scalindua sp. AMX11]|nr:MAG: hypothetical protein DWQ00_05120 [Candidatus Scalindua sp.]NOG84336.1 hypothetical protein [Planctomycetota bacterium]RZV74417.1 MAG: hypothetical protein EX341_13005 [Candidatus Scalindua sp. SCAELEC01]TDE65337.1 MAG: hypothetical protein D8M57_08265 [Candidatus Scalindua sp. AMX11]GJQ60838.1 MAG: hypothetical protein SCALA701_36390 [Candidatus Scalindua sp.]